MVRAFCLGVMAIILCLVPPPAASAAYQGDLFCRPAGKPLATVLLLHGGGFWFGSPEQLGRTCRLLASRGFRAVSLQLPLGDLSGQFETVTRRVRLERKRSASRLFTYGESAGGALALYPAARGWVDGAFAWAPVTQLDPDGCAICRFDLLTGSSPQQRARYSPLRWVSRRSSAALVIHGSADTTVPLAQNMRLARRWRHMRLIIAPGETHQPDQRSFQQAGETALRWFEQRMGTEPRKTAEVKRRHTPAVAIQPRSRRGPVT